MVQVFLNNLNINVNQTIWKDKGIKQNGQNYEWFPDPILQSSRHSSGE